MTHDEALSLLSARIDGPLSSDQQQALNDWLNESADNRILAEAFQSQHGELRTAFEPRREATKETAAAVARELTNAPSPARERVMPRWASWLVAPLPAAFAAAILIALGLIAFRRDRVEETPTPVASTDPIEDRYANLGLKPRDKPDAPKTAAAAVGNTVSTKAGEKRRVTLPDGSLLYLNQNTTVEVAENRHLKLRSGNIFVEAVRAQAEAQRFVVETAKRSVTALGTKFAVSANDAGTGVLVTQGKVEVSGVDQKLTSGQELLPEGDKIVPAPRASAALDWTRDLMIAAESPLVPAGKHSGGSLVAVDPYGQEAKLSLVRYHVDVHIEDGFARTTIDQTYFNSENSRMEGTFYFPLPPDGSLSRLAMYVEGDLMEGGMAESGHARNVYETIRYQNRDPALLEWVDGSVFKMRVFPLEARQEKRIVLSYTQRLPVLYGQATYRFPSGHTLALVEKWSFHAFVKDGASMSASSPSHPTMKLENKGEDLVVTDEAKNVKVDRDIVLTLHDHAAHAQGETVRWSSADFEGAKYLMFRYRPELPSAPRRERRDWVFLFESSGARDPLVARAQVEVIRSLLRHAEHEDTFAVLSVGTRVRAWSATPQAATPEKVAEAIEWLENRHLIGALNLDQALSDAMPLLQAGSNPHLVHVGGGVASIGEQRADVLVKRIPEGVKYVGIGVGKRFSPAFMKVAAERTGGLFTQVNPDEPIAWRGFEIASTLNAPRLLNVRVEAQLAEGQRFLTFSNALAHGEELAAVVRVVGATPQAATVRGTLDGQPFQKTLTVSNVESGAGYLPRTWAKLEIDRLLAENSAGNRQKITDLSKAMYVMTPFTSLLVLENEQMYKDFKVDRGRKDHWALYPCPPKIPVVYIPDPNQPMSQVDLKGQKPHENQVLQTIMTRTPPRFLTWPGHGGGDNAVMTAGQRFGATYFALPVEEDEEASFDGAQFGFESLDFDVPIRATSFGRDLIGSLGKPSSRTKLRLNDIDGKRLTEFNEFTPRQRGFMGRGGRNRREADLRALDRTPLLLDPAEPMVDMPNRPASGIEAGELDLYLKMPVSQRGRNRSSNSRFVNGGIAFDAEWSTLHGLHAGDELRRKHFDNLFENERISDFRRRADGWSEINSPQVAQLRLEMEDIIKEVRETQTGSFLLGAGIKSEAGVIGSIVADEKSFKGKDAIAERRMLGYMVYASQPPQYYGRPSYNGNHRVFTDLVAYAPGMSSSPADIRAVLETEAAPRFGSKRGSVDPEARKMIDAARSSEWKVLKVGEENPLAFYHDGQGRYAYERRVAFGLKEQVVCDGTHLWHLYPELGIGAKRTVSRFHRAFLFDLVPDFLPPADDLAHGADVKAIDAKTVALSPLMPPKDQEQPKGWLETRLVFDGNRLAERQWVLVLKDKPDDILIREVYKGNTTKWVVPKVKESATPQAAKPFESKREESPAVAPNLAPDMSQLVILPLPLRSRDHVYRELNMEPSWSLTQDKNGCFEYLEGDEAMKLLACEFASGNGSNVARVWEECFSKYGDDRTGFFTLMSSANYSPRYHWKFNQGKYGKDPNDPLVRYLWETHNGNIHEWQARLGIGPDRDDPDTFLGKLTSFRRIVARWQGDYMHRGMWTQRDGERTRALDFAVKNADNVLGWCTTAMVQDRCWNADAYKDVAGAWSVLAKKSAFPYPARYEEARCLSNTSDQIAAAEKKYQELFRDALKEGVLPPIDSSFRSVLDNGEQALWAKLMRETAAKCAEKKARPVIITLAWQCYQLGDTAMSDSLLEQALKDIPAEEKPYTSIAAIHFLNATSRYDRADKEVRSLLADAELAKSAGLWRLASQIASNRADRVRSIACLEKALDIEYERMPEVFDVQPIRNEYSQLLGHYEWLANASASLGVDPPKDLVSRVVKAADRWRYLDPESSDVPNRAAKILRKAGGEGSSELAWDYVTTPLAMKPNESDPWVSLAWSARQEGNWRLADKCYEMAFAAEPTNAQLLWDRAQHLQQQAQIAESRRLLKQLADSEWQPRFNGLKAQARQAIEGR